MKNVFIIALLSTVFLVACGGKNSYEMETFYSAHKDNGDTSMISEKDNIVAETDSAAFLKAQENFSSRMNKSGDDKGIPVKFTLRNNDGIIVTQPGQQATREAEKTMYPNQKP